MLEKFGCQVEVVTNGFEVLEAVATVHYDLIFMDCQMPKMDGYAAARAIRGNEKGVKGERKLHETESARIPIMGLPGRRRERSRQFLIEYQDRILFGTDAIYDDTNVPTGIQAQCLYQPGEIPIGDADPHEKYVETTVEFVRSHIDFLTTDRDQKDPPFKRATAGYSIGGLALPVEVCDKILHSNARRLLGL